MSQKKTNKLIIFDYVTGIEHVYQIEPDVYVNAQYVRMIGHDPNKVVYMFGDLQRREHPGVLTKNGR